MPEDHKPPKQKVNRLKIYAVALGIFLVVNTAVETGITYLEYVTRQELYPIFPFTRIGLLVITILAINYYIRQRTGKSKPRLWWRITKPILLILLAYGLAMGAWLSVTQADADRAANNIKDLQQQWKNLPKLTSPKLDTSNEAN
jgi:O-antigen/teichoic acid export membrane protein